LKSIMTNQSTKIGLRVIVDGKLGESHSTDAEEIEGLVRRAVSTDIRRSSGPGHKGRNGGHRAGVGGWTQGL
jgi:predicted Zn-dependent protease